MPSKHIKVAKRHTLFGNIRTAIENYDNKESSLMSTTSDKSDSVPKLIITDNQYLFEFHISHETGLLQQNRSFWKLQLQKRFTAAKI